MAVGETLTNVSGMVSVCTPCGYRAGHGERRNGTRSLCKGGGVRLVVRCMCGHEVCGGCEIEDGGKGCCQCRSHANERGGGGTDVADEENGESSSI